MNRFLAVLLLFLAACTPGEGPEHVDVEREALQVIGQPGFYRTAEVDGTWWLLDPEDNKFFTIGINHIDPNFFLADEYREATLAKYGPGIQHDNLMANLDGPEAIAFMDWGTALTQSWGFNTLGAQNPIAHRTLPWVATFRPADLEGWSFMKRRYPDPFAKSTARALFKKATDWAEDKRDDPMIVGVTMTAMPIWHIKPNRQHEWYAALMKLPADAPGKVAWLSAMKERYRTPTQAAAVYGVQADSWSELAAIQQWGRVADPDAVRLDQRVFLPRIAKAWYSTVQGVIRKTMPNHLIFGDKFVPNRDLPDWMVPIVGENVDVLYLQWFTHADEQLATLRELHLRTGKPIIMGDFAFAHPNPQVPIPKGQEVDTQEDVGKAYATYVETLASEPYFIGLHHCGTFEGVPSLERIGPLVVRQQGFMRGDGTPYADTVQRVTQANKSAHATHERSQSREPLVCETTDREFDRLTQVGERVFELRGMPRAGGAPQKPISWIIGDDAVAVYDTGSPALAASALEVIRSQTDLPIAYIIYSHHHGTQLGGAETLLVDGGQVVAHASLADHLRTVGELGPYYSRLNSIQFNGAAGLPGRFPFPTLTFRDRMTLDLGGVELELIHMVGEAHDYAVVWWEDERIAMVADLLPGGMPMVASPMKPVRDEVGWIHALTDIKELRPREVLRTAGVPTCNPQENLAHINAHIALLDFVHDAVIRELNQGSSEQEAVDNIRLPRELSKSPYLQERYGTLAFAVRGLYHRYSGWFDQDGSHIKPVSAQESAAAFIAEMGGRNRVLARARVASAQSEAKLALSFIDLLIDANPDDAEAHVEKSKALQALVPLADNKIERNMFKRTSTLHRQRAQAITDAE